MAVGTKRDFTRIPKVAKQPGLVWKTNAGCPRKSLPLAKKLHFLSMGRSGAAVDEGCRGSCFVVLFEALPNYWWLTLFDSLFLY